MSQFDAVPLRAHDVALACELDPGSICKATESPLGIIETVLKEPSETFRIYLTKSRSNAT